jgi:hypothetical protein
MTEAQWLVCTDPTPMLEFLRGKASERKLRLLACACCRHTGSFVDAAWKRMVAHRHPSEAEVELVRREADLAGRAVAVAERVADGLAGMAELAALVASLVDDDLEGCYADGPDATEAAAASAYRARWCANYMSPRSYPPGAGFRSPSKEDHDREQLAQCQLLRDLFGNPFRPLPSLAPSLLGWNDGTIIKLAMAIYEDRRFEDMGILADALEDAGCQNQDILEHCRQAGLVHVKGCWVLDLLLGKE